MSTSSSQHMARSTRTRKFKAEINVVPYVDVMLVLLVIFMAVAPMVNPSMVDLPNASRAAAPPTDYLEVILEPNQATQIYLHNQAGQSKLTQTNGKEELATQLQNIHNQYPDMALMISADKNIMYDEVMQVISQAKKNGITRVGLATKELN